MLCGHYLILLIDLMRMVFVFVGLVPTPLSVPHGDPFDDMTCCRLRIDTFYCQMSAYLIMLIRYAFFLYVQCNM